LPAEEKLNALWERISENQNSFEWYSSFAVSQIFLSDLWVTFKENGDVMPGNRKKLIHTVGNIAKGEFVPEKDTPYTGIFKGSKNLLLRLSLAKKPIHNPCTEGAHQNYIPGISLKFLRDGIPSGNILAMYSTSGQYSWNPFKHDFTNVFKIGSETISGRLLSTKFSSVTNMIGSVGVRDLAEYDENGNKEAEPRFPFRLIFRPTDLVNNIFPDTYTEELTEQLKTISPGTTLYNVYAIDDPGCEEYKIGSLRILTQLITSAFADEKLFFRHGLIDSDDDEKKNWSEYRDSFSIWGGVKKGKEGAKKSGCPFANLLG
jgi:hypothetical protein